MHAISIHRPLWLFMLFVLLAAVGCEEDRGPGRSATEQHTGVGQCLALAKIATANGGFYEQ